jgi:hypothetical protein
MLSLNLNLSVKGVRSSNAASNKKDRNLLNDNIKLSKCVPFLKQIVY